MKNSTIGVLGIGEVGRSIVELFKKKYQVLKKDKKYDDIKTNKIEVLHVCIPYSNNFSKIVTSQIKKNNPELVIIHSTVAPGTSSAINLETNTPVVHSPIMGTHDNLPKHILKFKKFIGPVDIKSANLAKKHLQLVGIKTKVLNKSIDSELGKLLDTAYYAWNIIFGKIAWEICGELNANYEVVYKEFNKTYNEGYKNTKKNVTRPVLNYLRGPIGGHCVIPNAVILDKLITNVITKVILNQNRNYSKDN